MANVSAAPGAAIVDENVPADLELARVIQAWPVLTQTARAAIGAIVRGDLDE